ncbi:hypothetical protein V491_02689 [Pseudogymnoascus sp. VKM F-3775]|nr:hypothetical protein V491_02689 [Pseudogymnoascus sp. VKM F-3775]
MESPLTMSPTDAFYTLEPGLPSVSYPDAYIDYQVPDFFKPSCLSGTTYPFDDTQSAPITTANAPPLDLPKPHADPFHFFADSSFSSPTPNQHYVPLKLQTYSPTPWAGQEGGWNNNNNNNSNSNNNNNQHNATITGAQASFATLTSGFEPSDACTVIHHGQVTPGDSPEEMESSVGPAAKGSAGSARRGARKGKVIVSVASLGDGSEPAASPSVKVKKARKHRRSSKKMTTAEQAAAKRETYLTRNREAAYKCRMKKKMQTEEVIERVEALGEDNRVKSVEGLWE